MSDDIRLTDSSLDKVASLDIHALNHSVKLSTDIRKLFSVRVCPIALAKLEEVG